MTVHRSLPSGYIPALYPSPRLHEGVGLKSNIITRPIVSEVECTSALGGLFAVQSPCPLWVKSRHVQCTKACPLYPQSRPQMRPRECPLWANSGLRGANPNVR